MQPAEGSRWKRVVLRFQSRDLWRWHGLPLWLVRQPLLRYWPIPFPSSRNLEDYRQQLKDTVRDKPWIIDRLRRLTAAIFKDLLTLRNRLGVHHCFLANDSVLRALNMVKSSRGVMERARMAAVHEQLSSSTPDVTQLLGPKGGVPRTKDKLVLLAISFGIPAQGTVAELQTRCREALGTTRCQQRAGPAPSTVIQTGPGVGRMPSSASGAAGSGSDQSLFCMPTCQSCTIGS